MEFIFNKIALLLVAIASFISPQSNLVVSGNIDESQLVVATKTVASTSNLVSNLSNQLDEKSKLVSPVEIPGNENDNNTKTMPGKTEINNPNFSSFLVDSIDKMVTNYNEVRQSFVNFKHELEDMRTEKINSKNVAESNIDGSGDLFDSTWKYIAGIKQISINDIDVRLNYVNKVIQNLDDSIRTLQSSKIKISSTPTNFEKFKVDSNTLISYYSSLDQNIVNLQKSRKEFYDTNFNIEDRLNSNLSETISKMKNSSVKVQNLNPEPKKYQPIVPTYSFQKKTYCSGQTSFLGSSGYTNITCESY